MTKVKICGITEAEHAAGVVKAGADFIGLVFAPSKRQLVPDKAREIVLGLNSLTTCPQVVGVFVNMPHQKVNQLSKFCQLDCVQLSGDETWQYCKKIEKPLIKAIRIMDSTVAEDVLADISYGYKILGSQILTCLLDAQVDGSYGGTGKTFNWKLAIQVARRFPVIIAGGLSPDNVGQAIKIIQPWGVDVSSGVETAARKDLSKIKAFIEAVRNEDENTG